MAALIIVLLVWVGITLPLAVGIGKFFKYFEETGAGEAPTVVAIPQNDLSHRISGQARLRHLTVKVAPSSATTTS